MRRFSLITLIALLPALYTFSSAAPHSPDPACQPPDSLNLNPQQVHSLSVLGKVWGFLKYYHPHVADGRYDWDSVLIQKVQLFVSFNSQQEINTGLSKWLTDLGGIDRCGKCKNDLPDSLHSWVDTAWMGQSGFDAPLADKFRYILAHRQQDARYYATHDKAWQVKTDHEKSYWTPAFAYPPAAWRLLTLFRYWNIVNYYAPYKGMTTQPWPNVLDEFVPAFYGVADTLNYQLLVLKLISRLDDSHTTLTLLPALINYFGAYRIVPFQCSIVNGKAIVSHLWNKTLCDSIGVKIGTVFISIDQETVNNKFARVSQYIGASNDRVRLRQFADYYLFAGHDSLCKAVVETAGGQQTVTFPRYNNGAPVFDHPDPANVPLPPCKILDGNIGYVNMGVLGIRQVDSVMGLLKTTRAIIFDVRSYPRNTWPAVTKWLTDKEFILNRIYYPDFDYPGLFLPTYSRSDGGPRKNVYTGKVVILVDVNTQSHAEYSVMALQAAAPRAVTIGNTTAGADGNITDWIMLPGGMRTRFSGLDIRYPDGGNTQRKGVRIDIPFQPTERGLIEGRDELLEKAIQYLSN
jgi:hypothetical protein